MSLDDINSQSIQTLLRGENDSKQSDEFQATFNLENKTTFSNIPFVSENFFLNSHPESHAH